MSRRHAAGILTAASLLAVTSPASAVDYDETDFPRAVCSRAVTDAPGDAKYSLQTAGTVPVPRPNDFNVPPLDVLGLAFTTTETDFKAYLKVANLSQQHDQTETAYQWEITFETAHAAVLLASRKVSSTYAGTAVQPSSSADYPKGTFTIGTTQGAFTPVHLEHDATKSTIVFKVALSELQKVFPDGMTAGTSQITKIAVRTLAFLPTSVTVGRVADTVATDVNYTIGDSYCFGPPPGALSGFVTKTVQYTDTTTLSATLKSEAGDALAGKTVEFRVAGESAVLRGTTNAAGLATVTYKPTIAAGKPKVTVSFPGDAEHGKTSLVGDITVAAEKTAFNPLLVAKPTATTRRVTATLLDDDKKPVAGQKVDFYVNGKRVASITTNSKGQAVYSGAKPAQSVYAKYAGLSGKYLTATSKTVKV